MKTLKVIYNGRKGAHLHYDALTQDVDRPKFCEKWETKRKRFINWNISLFFFLIKNPGNKTETVPNQTGTQDISDKCYIYTQGC